MADSSRLFRAAFGSIAILGGAVLGVTVMTSTYAANNFNKAQCKVINGANGLTKGLAVEEGSANTCVCPPQTAFDRRQQRAAGANAGLRCLDETPEKVTNFNQPSSTSTTNGSTTTGSTTSTTNGSTTNGSTTSTSSSALGNPGNHKLVGRATEGPPKGTRNGHFGCCGPGNTTDNTGATGPTGGDKGASN